MLARILEDAGKKFLAEAGLKVPESKTITAPDEITKALDELGEEVVLKALVPVGKRKKAGAIKFPSSREEAQEMISELFAMEVREFPVNKVLIEEKVAIEEEYYISITYDKKSQLPVVITSSAGGIDVEEMSREHPDKIKKYQIDPFIGLPDYKARELWAELGFSGKLLRQLGQITSRVYQVFTDYDCTTLEINPLVLTADQQILPADCVMATDDLAIFRQPELEEFVQVGSERLWRPLTELEKEIVAVNEAEPYRGTARYIELEGGEIGFMCGGGGGSLVMFDSLMRLGERPANYTEFGGNPTATKVYGLAKGIMKKPGVKGLLVCCNITNNTQVDKVAEGVVKALTELDKDPAEFPIVVRYAGVNDERGKEIFENAGIEYHGEDITMPEAAEMMVEKIRQLNSGGGSE